MKRWVALGVIFGFLGSPLAAQPPVSSLTDRINQRMEVVWKAKGIRLAEPASDTAFLRRVTLDLTGCIPTAGEVRAFLADTKSDRYERVVERLLNGPGYVRHMTNVWRDEFLPPANGPQVSLWRTELEGWLRRRLRERVSYDRLAREVLTVSLTFDPTTGRGQVSPLPFYRVSDLKPENVASAVSRTFLGIHLDCAQCHDHPFEPWTQRQFAEFAAFFAGAKATRMQSGRVAVAVEDPSIRSFALPEQAAVTPKFLDGTIPQWGKYLSPRAALADWIVLAENPYFTRHAINHVWGQFFGSGLALEGDANFEGLLKELSADFAATGFDSRRLAQAIVLSRPYRLASLGQAPTHLFARMRTRGLSVDQMQDSLARATGLAEESFPSLWADFRARFQQVGEKPADRQPSVLQVLTLMNGSLVGEVTQGPMVKAVREAPWLDAAGRVEEFFLMTLSRYPTPSEQARFTAHLEKGGALALGDVLWVLINSSEFLLNH